MLEALKCPHKSISVTWENNLHNQIFGFIWAFCSEKARFFADIWTLTSYTPSSVYLMCKKSLMPKQSMKSCVFLKLWGLEIIDFKAEVLNRKSNNSVWLIRIQESLDCLGEVFSLLWLFVSANTCCRWFASSLGLLWQLTAPSFFPPVLLLSMMPCRDHVPSQPILHLQPLASKAAWEAAKSLALCKHCSAKLNHLCVSSAVLTTNQNHGAVWAIAEKTNSIPTKIEHWDGESGW